MEPGDTKQNEKVNLEADNTFTIRHQGQELKFQIHASDRLVELVSVSGAEKTVSTISNDSLLRLMTSPKVTFEKSLLEKLSRAGTVVFSDLNAGVEGLEVTLPSLSRLSKDITKRGGIKPLVVLRVPEAGKAGSLFDLNKTIGTFRAGKYGVDAHVVSVPGLGKKSGL
jgi:hypothetical protein